MSQETSKKSSKRKSMGEAGPSESKVRVAEMPSGLGPVFVNFPAVKPSSQTPFHVYSRNPESDLPIAKQHTILAGETEDVEFVSVNRDRQGGEGADCQYLPAIYNPDTGSLEVYPSAPLYLVGQRIKRLRYATLSSTDRATDYKARRNDLGEAFGTKKAKSQIRSEERNKVDIGAMQGIKGHLMETIGETAEEDKVGLPSELIPQPNMSTLDVAAVYPRDALCPEGEWTSIDAKTLLRAKDDEERKGLLPYRRVGFSVRKIRLAAQSGSSSQAKKETARMAYYLAALLGLYDMSGRISKLSTKEIGQKLPGIPSPLLGGMLERFTEASGKRRTVTEKTKTKLLAWICVVYLHLDEFSVEVGRLAHELSLPPGKISDMFKSLGCKVDVLGPAEREKQGLSMADARNNRRAILRAPVVFPKPKTRAPARR